MSAGQQCECVEAGSAEGVAHTTAFSAKGPDTTSGDKDMALAQCVVADSQSWASMAACSAPSEFYRQRSAHLSK